MKNVTVDTDTLKQLIVLADGWWNIVQAFLRPLSIVTLLTEDDPKKAIDFIRRTCNEYCDHLEKLMPKADVPIFPCGIQGCTEPAFTAGAFYGLCLKHANDPLRPETA